jgi:XRE family aerobic/anaerobic benzoate catabolism transcriptional regulator
MHPPVHPAGAAPRKPAAKSSANDSGAAASETQWLLALGEQVREARARLGMTRRALATASGISERYLALLETGHGNISVLLLLRVATALGLPLGDLFRAPQERPAGKRRRIALIGLRGAGKSTLGEQLAQTLDMPFVELDREIEREAGTSLSEIFLLYGQEGYRRYEKRCLEAVIAQHERVVIATGGSLVSEPATFNLLLTSCTTIWLKAQPEEHMARVIAQGDTRPMAGNREAMRDLVRILDGRKTLYGKADITVDTAAKSIHKSLQELTRAITRQLEEQTT